MILIVSAASMNTATFYKHWNARHMPMAGTAQFHPSPIEDSATKALRTYHERIHRLGQVEDHCHE